MLTNKLFQCMGILLLLTLLLSACSNNGFEKASGSNITYSEYFKDYDGLDKREKVTFYQPVPIDDMIGMLPKSVSKGINRINPEHLPFEVEEEKAFLVTSEDEKVKHQVQLSYINKSEYDQVKDFFIVSITEAEENPFKNNSVTDKVDYVGNELRKEILTGDTPIYQQIITTNGGLVYSYYDFDEDKKQVITVGTIANEIYAYYNGYIYHIGYFVGEKNSEELHEAMLQLAREFILGTSD